MNWWRSFMNKTKDMLILIELLFPIHNFTSVYYRIQFDILFFISFSSSISFHRSPQFHTNRQLWTQFENKFFLFSFTLISIPLENEKHTLKCYWKYFYLSNESEWPLIRPQIYATCTPSVTFPFKTNRQNVKK